MSDLIQLVDGRPIPEDNSHLKINQKTGLQQDYVVLSPEERAKGFVKPVRRSYKHNGPPQPKTPLRELTTEEHARYDKFHYVMYEEYAPQSALCGRYWTQHELDRLARGCGVVTTMHPALAETYARKPDFYSGTYCSGCGDHFSLNEFTWEPDGEPMDTRLQEDWAKGKTARDAELAETRRLARVGVLREKIAEMTRELEALGG